MQVANLFEKVVFSQFLQFFICDRNHEPKIKVCITYHILFMKQLNTDFLIEKIVNNS
jgi:hypothetical protein